MPTYILLEGFHAYRNPTTDELVKIKAGDEIEAPLDTQGNPVDLCAKFVNKFRLKDDGQTSAPVTPERRAAVERLITEANWPMEDRQFLLTLSEDAFRRVVRRDQARGDNAQLTESGGEDESAAKTVKSRFGEDVTSQFQQAYDEGFCVFVNGSGKYQITRRDRPSKALNKEPLDAPEAVTAFVVEFLADARR